MKKEDMQELELAKKLMLGALAEENLELVEKAKVVEAEMTSFINEKLNAAESDNDRAAILAGLVIGTLNIQRLGCGNV